MTRGLTAVALATTAMALSVSSASAAVEVGSDCVAGNATGAAMFSTRTAIGTSVLVVPSAGVVTSWKVKSGIVTTAIEQLKVLRPTSVQNRFTTVAESAAATVGQGVNLFSARIPVQAGDRLGVAPAPGGLALFCSTNIAGDEVADFESGELVTVGSTKDFLPLTGRLTAVSAMVEPDVDGDGFGDESQDSCPRSAKLQAECPVIQLAVSGKATKTSALVQVGSNASTQVSVAATVSLPGKTINGRKGKAKVLALGVPAQTVAAKQTGSFVFAFPVRLKAALKALSRQRSLSLKVIASATDALGQPSSSALVLRLKGQAKTKK